MNATNAARDLHTATPGLGTAPPLHRDAFTLPANPTAVPQARHRLTQHLAAWHTPPTLHDDAALILSELITNALVHTDTPTVTCRILAAPYTLYLSVTDHGRTPTTPHLHTPTLKANGTTHGTHEANGTHITGADDIGNEADDADEHGRGLLLVNALSHTWGVETTTPHGRTVWAVLNPNSGS